MAKRRTKQQKLAAKLHRLTLQNQVLSQKPAVIPIKPDIINEGVIKHDFYVPELSLSTKLLTYDLTKSLAVTILALILQFGLALYLNHGGWQTVHNMLQKLAINY